MSDGQAKINDYRLEPAQLDWRSVRVQMVIGMSAIFCLCLVNFWSVTPIIAENCLSITNGLPASFLLPFLITAFCLYFASCLLTALIALEITGRFGNRLSASCALWSALLFCVFPWLAHSYTVGLIISGAISFFFLLVVFLCVRSGKQMPWLIVLLAIILSSAVMVHYLGYCLSDANGRDLTVDSALLLYPIHIIISQKNTILPDANVFLSVAYLIAGLTCSLRFGLRNLNAKALWTVIICLLTTLVFIDLGIYTTFDQKGILRASFMTLACAFLSITISLACLPAIDNGRIGLSRVVGCLGLVALVMFAITFEELFTSVGSDQIHYPLRSHLF